MAALSMCRSALRRNVVPLSLGLSAGAMMISRQTPLRFDSRPAARSMSSGRKDRLDPEVIKQLSGGSLSGFFLGLVVSVFSKTLVLLVGLSITAVQVASRFGIDIVGWLNLRKRVESSRILSSLVKRPAFGISFGLTFALSAFMSF
ncbi:hypothetical protein QBC33DRAFT_535661 [Phialemonium atrogriseum]|uniref:Fun14 family protein n=1 Tax=Phialemonium atrogriseum TaxID=1093897 RepID=A0AAJ0FIB9_9PEZI|nr:uncharacterized protein QBC33DRAFT_535661 [Phialemonium atrogriseum]KAK1768642.1 hypothetical protein QBC33DRAFT_535661 [Phialemonium atrogriseum]